MGQKLGCSAPDDALIYTYFPLKARGFPVLLALEVGKVEYNPVIVQLGSADWAKMKKSGDCPFDCLPMIEFPDGTRINETNACLAAAGIKGKKTGSTESAQAISAMLACKCAEVFSESIKVLPMFFNVKDWNAEKNAAMEKWKEEQHKDYLTKFEALCKDDGKFTPEGDTIGELHLFSNLFQLIDCGFLVNNDLPPKLQKFYERVAKIPEVKKCCDDKTKMPPCQNPYSYKEAMGTATEAPKVAAPVPVPVAAAPPAAAAVSASPVDYTVYYHTECKGFYGRAFPLLAMLTHANKSFEVKETAEAPAGAGFAAPMVKFPAGNTIAQTNVLVANIGKDCGLSPDGGVAKEAKAKQFVADAGDLMQEMMDTKSDERLNKWLSHLDSRFEGPHFLGGLTYVDFAFYNLVSVIKLKQAKGKFEGLVIPDKIKIWHAETMPKVAAIKQLENSGVPLLPDSFL